jgi:hypothetical protein
MHKADKRVDQGTKNLTRELVRQASILYREAGDLLCDVGDVSKIIGDKEANHKLRQAIRILVGKHDEVCDRIRELRRWTAKIKSATATQLEIDIFDE